MLIRLLLLLAVPCASAFGLHHHIGARHAAAVHRTHATMEDGGFDLRKARIALDNFFKGDREQSPFEALALDEKVAVVRVAKCLPNSEGPLGAPVARPEWMELTEETWADVKSEYPILESLAEETLEAAVLEVRAKK